MHGTRGGYGCDMRGMLSFQIMWLLSKKEMHGEEIAEEIAKRRGSKPKAGTIYPALKSLEENGVITGEKKGKTVVYSLTSEGKRSVKRAVIYFCRSFGEIFEGSS
ncbi:MAG: PadR family transcriptional regulator [Candidatus Marsarchaeota archaeon]|nr:PadR family transcriptional regulator [Candidatus Marsarchaeota archaeon]